MSQFEALRVISGCKRVVGTKRARRLTPGSDRCGGIGKVRRSAALRTTAEFRIGLEAKFDHVETQILVFVADPNTYGVFERQPDD